MEVTEAGILMEVNDEQFSNALSSIDINEFGNITDINLLQCTKVFFINTSQSISYF